MDNNAKYKAEPITAKAQSALPLPLRKRKRRASGIKLDT